MSELQIPDMVSFDLRVMHEDASGGIGCIGVVTDISVGDNVLCVTGGVGSYGLLHDDLANKIRPGRGKIIPLPPEMSSTRGSVLAGFCPDVKDSLMMVSGQIDAYYNPEAIFTYKQTDMCLRMAALALGSLVVRHPDDLAKFKNPRELMFGAAFLRRLDRQIGGRIF